ncbi:MAG TPA: hypothetical protein VN922_03830, partial [Bacteroidia bacterium]|nr:hypothetical protein [Bacteroidia bacterium]
MSEGIPCPLSATFNINLPGLEGVKISTHIEVPDGFQSDRQFVHSILYNLIHNSLKFKRDITGSAINISAICR